MSSHREAPEISKDPVADGTDTYAFVSPDKPGHGHADRQLHPAAAAGRRARTSTSSATTSPTTSRSPTAAAGRRTSSTGSGFTTKIRNPKTFLYNTGPINNIGDSTWNRPQYYSVTRTEGGRTKLLASSLHLPAGQRRQAQHAELREARRRRRCTRVGNRKVFAGQRADAFHVDLGSIFDLGALRPFNEAHLISMPNMNGVNSVQSYNVHTIALQVPISDLSRNGDIPKDPSQRQRGDRGVGDGQPAEVADVGRQEGALRRATARGSRSRGSATRCSTRCWCRWPRRTSGTG